ncbi:MAG: alpha/beta hydrolase [Gemmatimonadetes bacterium]|nr:alpha/beta hydrolase [Gemmatimonadota bacterium]
MTTPPRRHLLTIFLTFFALYLGWAAFLFLSQRRMMFPAPRLAAAGQEEDRAPADVQQVWLDVSGDRVEAWFLAAEDTAPAPAVLFAHGNAELIDHALFDGRGLRELGMSVLLVEYPGYGRSEGRPTRSSIGQAFDAAYDWLRGRDEVDPARIVGMGRSLGTGAITDLARERSLQAMVLISPFTSVGAFAKGYLLPAFLALDRFDNLAVLRHWQGPVLLIHGTRDRIIPHTHSERLVQASPSAELVSLDCGHNDCPPNEAVYLDAIRAFLAEAGVL